VPAGQPAVVLLPFEAQPESWAISNKFEQVGGGGRGAMALPCGVGMPITTCLLMLGSSRGCAPHPWRHRGWGFVVRDGRVEMPSLIAAVDHVLPIYRENTDS
jgi:hypothetical protein